MANIARDFASIKALRNIAADQFEHDPVRSCAMALQACDRMLAFCADNEVQIPTDRSVVQTALYRFMQISQGGETLRRLSSTDSRLDEEEVSSMALDLLGVMDVLFEAVQRNLPRR